MRKYLPPLILFFLLLIGWQALALGINAAYILPTPIQVIQKLWELREPLFMVHLPLWDATSRKSLRTRGFTLWHRPVSRS